MIKKLINEIKRQQAISEVDMDSVAPENLNRSRNMRSLSIVKLKDLTEEYKKVVLQKSTFILVYGSEAQNVANGLKEIDPIFEPNNAGDIASKIVDLVDKRADAKPVSSNKMLEIISNVMEGVFLTLGVIEYNRPIYNTSLEGMIKNREDVTKLVEKLLRTQIGMEAVGLFAARQSTEVALKDHFDGESLPIVVYSNNQTAKELQRDLKKITDKVFTISAGTVKEDISDIHVEESNEDELSGAIQLIVSKINNNKKEK